jgi:predicted amidohydrolase
MEWVNVDFRPHQKREMRPVQIVRLAAVQYEMRPIGSWDEFERQLTYFVDTAGDYRCDFVTFPELFTTQLLSLVDAKRPSIAARKLADFNERYIELCQKLALRYHVNIVGGSNFAVENDKLYNIAYLFRRDGSIGKQYKIHVTPSEWRWWGVTGGDKVEVFDTDCGRVAIFICYDIEFPELVRIAA